MQRGRFRLRVDMCVDMRWACATHRWKALAEAVILSIGVSIPNRRHAVGDGRYRLALLCCGPAMDTVHLSQSSDYDSVVCSLANLVCARHEQAQELR